MIWLFALLIISITILDLPGLYKDKSYKEILIYVILLVAGVYMGIAEIYTLLDYYPLLELADYLEIH
jgi:hypothetical protein